MSKPSTVSFLICTVFTHIIFLYRIESQGNTLNKRFMNNLIEAAVKAGALDVATQLVLELEKKGEYPLIRIFKFLMNALVSSGDQKAIRTIGECINEVSF